MDLVLQQVLKPRPAVGNLPVEVSMAGAEGNVLKTT
jgi:hypothetical protein